MAAGNHGPEAISALFLLDWSHEQGELSTRGAQLSGAQLGWLSELRD